jgi:hypothetical protein
MSQHCGSTIRLSTCGHTATITEPLSLYSQPLRRATCVRTGNAEVGAFAFQRRRFGRDEACCGSARFRVGRIASSVATCLKAQCMPRVYTAGCVRGLAGSTPAVPTKAPSTSGRKLTQLMGLHGPHPRNTGRFFTRAIAAQPVREGLAQERRYMVRQAGSRLNRGLMGTLGYAGRGPISLRLSPLGNLCSSSLRNTNYLNTGRKAKP